MVGNTVGKGEIARYEQFLLFPQCFQKAFFPGASKGVIVCEWVKHKSHKIIKKKAYSYCHETNVFSGILESGHLSVCQSICEFMCLSVTPSVYKIFVILCCKLLLRF